MLRIRGKWNLGKKVRGGFEVALRFEFLRRLLGCCSDQYRLLFKRGCVVFEVSSSIRGFGCGRQNAIRRVRPRVGVRVNGFLRVLLANKE